jgi:signal transduction histidine kinase/CheY-like chemotaxis protein/CHASE3 domain sensor protein
MKSTINSRIYFGFTIAILLVLMVGLISYATFRRQTSQAEQVKHTYKVINQLIDLQNLLIDMETGRRGFRSTNQKKFLEPYTIALGKLDQTIAGAKQMVSDNPIQTQRLQKVEEDAILLTAYWKSLGDDASNYNIAIITDIVEKEKLKMDRIRLRLDEMMTSEETLLKEREEANSQSVQNAILGLTVGILLILLIVGVLIYFILKEFRSRKKAEAELQKNNEELVAVYNASAEKNWMLAGLADVNNSLQGLSDTEKLSMKVLSRVVKYLQLNAGAIYLLNDENKQLVLASSIGLTTGVKTTYLLNEGFVGQAASQTEPLLIKNIPAKSLIIEGGTVQVDMVQAMYAPLFLNDELKGVLELLTYGSFEDRHIELLKLIDNNISVAINSAQSREKVMELLEKVQQQKEELETQQEELRQANEELSVQTEVLQSSEQELRVQEEELRQINTELEEKNEAIETATQALILKAQELENTNKYKSEFLANMSHELRTPLNSVLILARLFADNNHKNLTEKQVAHAKIIYKSGSDLLHLINDILDLSKLEAGKVDIDIEEVPVASIAADLEQMFAVQAEEKGIHFKVNVESSAPVFVTTDKQKIEQVLKNLLSNAVKFTSKDGLIDLSFGRIAENGVDKLSIKVSDTGIGISAEKHKLIFEAFQQADGSTSRKYGGTGLGLSITKELIRLLDGKITLNSDEGRGSTFNVILPLKMVVTKPQAMVSYVEDQPSLKLDKVEEQHLVKDDRQNLVPGNKVMLIIEDDQVFAAIMRDWARDKGYKTVVALRGDEGLYYATKYKPNAIVLDIKLPGIEGSKLLSILKGNPDLKHIPIHIISGVDESSIDSSAALAFLKKPVQKQDIEKAFTIIGEYLNASVKRVLLLAGEHLKEQVMQQLLSDRHFDVKCDLAPSFEVGLQMISEHNYDCIIADIGSGVQEGIANMKQVHSLLRSNKTPLIIYLDKDISPADELELKKLSKVIVRKSSSGYSRLMDELELFLYKVNEDRATPAAKYVDSEPVNSQDLKAKKVLLVDDDMRNVFALTAALEHHEMNILTAGDGREAIDALEKNKGIDIVLMDIMMPEMDGYEAMRYIRNDLQLTRLPIIALTAKAMIGDREKCIEAGASDYITKPVDIQKLVSLMRVWLS